MTNDLLQYRNLSLTADRDVLATTRSDRHSAIWVGDGQATSGQDMVGEATDVGVSVAWAGDRLLFIRGESVTSLAPGGSGRVEVATNAQYVAASADGRRLFVESSERGERGGSWLHAEGGRPVRVLVEADNTNAVVTPDGRHALFQSSRIGSQSLWMVPLDGGTPVKVGDDPLPGQAFDVSSDGRSIVFSRGPNAEPGVVVCRFPDCSERRTMAIPPRGLGRIRFTPGGRGIAFKDPTSTNLMVQPLDGSPAFQLTRFTDRRLGDFAWSSDGRRLAIQRSTTANDIVLFKGLQRPR